VRQVSRAPTFDQSRVETGGQGSAEQGGRREGARAAEIRGESEVMEGEVDLDAKGRVREPEFDDGLLYRSPYSYTPNYLRRERERERATHVIRRRKKARRRTCNFTTRPARLLLLPGLRSQ
jgi:hypothetical protein